MRVLHHYWLNTGSRFCRLLLAEQQLDVLLKLEHPRDQQDAFLALNPVGTTPVMVEDEVMNVSRRYFITIEFNS